MGMFKSFFGYLAKPYTRAARDVASSAANIKKNLSKANQDLTHRNNEGVEYIDAPDASAAFEALYIKNKWTEEELVNQKKAVSRAKWVSLFFAWITFCLFLAFGIFGDNAWTILIGCVFCFFVTLLFCIKVIQFSLYQTQLHERYLTGFKEFMSRKDFWKRIFA